MSGIVLIKRTQQAAWRRGVCALVLGVLMAWYPSGASAAYADSPIEILKQTNGQISKLLRENTTDTSRKKRIEGDLKRAVGRFLDFEELAKLALSRHWDARTNAERADFVAILQQLIERNYVKQIRGNLKYEIKYRDEKVDGNTAIVRTSVFVRNSDAPADEVAIEYKMKKAGQRWMVYDVVTDDVSIVRNYRSQFNRIITRQSYRALVQKMKRKLKTI